LRRHQLCLVFGEILPQYFLEILKKLVIFSVRGTLVGVCFRRPCIGVYGRVFALLSLAPPQIRGERTGFRPKLVYDGDKLYEVIVKTWDI
jgi:hypothetical protein